VVRKRLLSESCLQSKTIMICRSITKTGSGETTEQNWQSIRLHRGWGRASAVTPHSSPQLAARKSAWASAQQRPGVGPTAISGLISYATCIGTIAGTRRSKRAGCPVRAAEARRCVGLCCSRTIKCTGKEQAETRHTHSIAYSIDTECGRTAKQIKLTFLMIID
jgi:hypothetical protein